MSNINIEENIIPQQDEETEIILAQWQTCVEMADSISHRRDAMNNLFITLNLAISTAISIVWDIKSIIVLFVGIVFCIIWIFLIRNFKNLNKEKFSVINDLEQKLPEKPFSKEWGKLKSNKSYKDGTKIEYLLPIIFIFVYVIAIIAILVTHIKSL